MYLRFSVNVAQKSDKYGENVAALTDRTRVRYFLCQRGKESEEGIHSRGLRSASLHFTPAPPIVSCVPASGNLDPTGPSPYTWQPPQAAGGNVIGAKGRSGPMPATAGSSLVFRSNEIRLLKSGRIFCYIAVSRP